MSNMIWASPPQWLVVILWLFKVPGSAGNLLHMTKRRSSPRVGRLSPNIHFLQTYTNNLMFCCVTSVRAVDANSSWMIFHLLKYCLKFFNKQLFSSFSSFFVTQYCWLPPDSFSHFLSTCTNARVGCTSLFWVGFSSIDSGEPCLCYVCWHSLL